MNVATDCTNELGAFIAEVAKFKKVHLVTSVDDFVAKVNTNPRPAVAIMYEGARPISTPAGNDINVSAEVVFSVLILLEQPMLNLSKDQAPMAHTLLDDIRRQIHGKRSQYTGHRWKWVVEAPVAVKGVTGVWIQRWSCNTQVVPT